MTATPLQENSVFKTPGGRTELDAPPFDVESLVLRRADPDDCDMIINLPELGYDDHYNKVFAYPKILKLIETAYLAISIVDRDTGLVVAFASFEDCPPVSKAESC
jgi:hypothetical protein